MSEIEQLEAEYRVLATRLIYAGFEGAVDPTDWAKLDQMSDELIDLNAADFSAGVGQGALTN